MRSRFLKSLSVGGRYEPLRERISLLGLEIWLANSGYNPGGSVRESGEAWLVDRLGEEWGEVSALVIDCGANSGSLSRHVLEATNFKVVAIEPAPERVAELQELERSYPERGRVFPVGVGRESGEGTLLEVGHNSAGSTFAPEVLAVDYLAVQTQGKVKCQIRTVDEIIDEVTQVGGWSDPIALLKFDIEGLEDEALAGSRTVLEQNPQLTVQFEGNWHCLFRGTTVRSLASLVPHRTLYQLLPGRRGLKRRQRDDWKTNVYAHGNWVLLPSSMSIGLES